MTIEWRLEVEGVEVLAFPRGKPGPVDDSVPRFPHLSPPVCFRIK